LNKEADRTMWHSPFNKQCSQVSSLLHTVLYLVSYLLSYILQNQCRSTIVFLFCFHCSLF